MPTTSARSVNLDELVEVRGTVTLDKKKVPVLPIDGVSYHLLVEGKKNGNEAALLAMYQVARQCLPSLPEERVMKLTAAQVGAVVAAASETVEQVEATASPNSEPAGITQKA